MSFNNFPYKNKRLHFVGVGGISMCALAEISAKLGACVSGSDDNYVPERLLLHGVKAYVGTDTDVALCADMSIRSAAIPDDNPELRALSNAGIPIIDRAQYLKTVCDLFERVITVSGCHGKTSVSCHITQILRECGVPASAHIGGISLSLDDSYILDGEEMFVTEACEYRRSFLSLRPDVAVVTNVDFDHPDCYNDIHSVKNAFNLFSKQIKDVLICPLSEKGLINATSAKKVYAIAPDQNDIEIADIRSFYSDIRHGNVDVISYVYELSADGEKTAVNICLNGKRYLDIELPLSAGYEVRNAVFAVIAALNSGCKSADIAAVTPFLRGAKRRMEKLSTADGIIYRDYAHHPTEIRAAIDKLSIMYPEKEIYVFFEPHTFSRTKALISEFEKCFENATRVLILPTFSARERPEDGIDSVALFSRIKHNKKEYIENYDILVDYIKSNADKNVVFLLLGAGSIGEALTNIDSISSRRV